MQDDDLAGIREQPVSDSGTCLISEPMQTERLPNGRRKLLRQLVVCSDGSNWIVEKGLETDYSTIPAIGRFLVRWSKVDLAGVVHDALYKFGTVTSRARADRLWRIIAQAGEHSANPIQAWIAWAALRGFGGIAWAGHRRTASAWIVGTIQATIATLVILAVLAALWSIPRPWQ